MATSFFSASGSIRRRIFLLLVGMSFGSILIVNLIWLPSSIREIKEEQMELRHASIRLVRDQIKQQFENEEGNVRNTAMRMRPYVVDGDREQLRLIAQQRLQSDLEFEEIGILDNHGKEFVKVARKAAVTEGDLLDRSRTPLFHAGLNQEIHWGPVAVGETSEPHVTLTTHLPGSNMVFGLVNLKYLLSLTQEFKLHYDGRAYIVDSAGRLIAAADPSLVLKQTSYADRSLIKRLLNSSTEDAFAEGDYINESGARMVATGLRFARPHWVLVIEQPESLLFAPIRQKIWFFLSLSLIGLLASFVLAQRFSRRFTGPIITLREGAEQVGSGNLEYRVPIETNDEIGDLARQFNLMADHLRSARQATLSALTIPIISQTSELKEVLSEVILKVMKLTGADAASIRLVDDKSERFIFSVHQGFSEGYTRNRPLFVGDDAEVKAALQTGQIIIKRDLSDPSSSDRSPLVQEGFHGAAFLPLKTPQKTLGVMQVVTREAGRFGPEQTDLFAAMAHQISIALHNARLFQDTERNLERIGALHDIVLAATSSLDLAAVLGELLQKIDRFLPYLAVTVQLRAEDTGRMEPAACRNIDEKDWRAHFDADGGDESPALGVAPLIVRNSGTDPRTSASAFLRRHALLSFAQLPLVAKGEVLGIITFYKREEHEFGGDELEFLNTLAGQAAIAICNAQLYEHSTEQAVELEKAAKRQADFSAMIVHDLRSPLSTIINIIEMMGNGLVGDLNQDQKKWAERIKTNAAGLVALVSDFLDVSKLEAGRIELSRKPTDIQGLLRGSVENFAPLAKTKNINLSYEKDGFLPVIAADGRRLDQVLNNLLSNALKFTAEGGSVQVTARHDPRNGIVVQVQDDGMGISPDEIGSLFQKYQQSASGKTSAHKGTGLGLVICKMIVEAHGGRIWVESEEGKGTTFTLTLPVTDNPAAAQNKPALAVAENQGANHGKI